MIDGVEQNLIRRPHTGLRREGRREGLRGGPVPPSLRARAYLPARRECDHAQAVHLCYPGWLATCLPALRPRGVRAVQPPLLVWSHAGGIGLGMYIGAVTGSLT